MQITKSQLREILIKELDIGSYLRSFEETYDVEFIDFSSLTGEEQDRMTTGEYEEYPMTIKRVDGTKFSEYDIENIKNYCRVWSKHNVPMENIKMLSHAKVGDSVVELEPVLY
jgi:hypothetical protein